MSRVVDSCRSFGLLLLPLLAVTLVSLAGCDAEGERRGLVVLPGMVEAVPFEAFSSNPLLPNGMTQQPPPVGTVPMDAEYFPFGDGEAEADRAGREWLRPTPATEADLVRGQEVFERYCLICHGQKGDADGPIIGWFPNPPSFHAPKQVEIPDGRMYHMITRGRGLMASYATQVRPEDRWRAISYIRSLQVAGLTETPSAFPAAAADADAAEAAPSTEESP